MGIVITTSRHLIHPRDQAPRAIQAGGERSFPGRKGARPQQRADADAAVPQQCGAWCTGGAAPSSTDAGCGLQVTSNRDMSTEVGPRPFVDSTNSSASPVPRLRRLASPGSKSLSVGCGKSRGGGAPSPSAQFIPGGSSTRSSFPHSRSSMELVESSASGGARHGKERLPSICRRGVPTSDGRRSMGGALRSNPPTSGSRRRSSSLTLRPGHGGGGDGSRRAQRWWRRGQREVVRMVRVCAGPCHSGARVVLSFRVTPVFPKETKCKPICMPGSNFMHIVT
jgi:hypothetical protein